MLELSGLVPTGTLSELAPELKASLQAGSIEIVLGYLDEHYDSLKQQTAVATYLARGVLHH